MIQAGRISVTHVVAQLEMGGMEKLSVEFARHMDREAFDLYFVSQDGRGKLADYIEACGWNVTLLHQPPCLRPELVFKLVCLFRGRGVDVVHIYITKPYLCTCLSPSPLTSKVR
jgi:hypothetical protein